MPPELENGAIATDTDASTNGQQNGAPPEIKDPVALLNTLETLKQSKKQLEAQLREQQQREQELQKQFGQYKPEQIEQWRQQVEHYEQNKLEQQQEYGKLKQKWQEEKQTYEQQLQSKKQEIVDLQMRYELEKSFYNSGGKAKADEKPGMASYFDLLMPIAQRYIVFEEGKIQVVDPADGARMFTAEGKPYTLGDLMAKLRSEGPTAELFQPTNNGAGGGMQANANGFRRGNQIDYEALSKLPPAERIRLARERNWT